MQQYRAVAAAVCWFALALQYVLILQAPDGRSALTHTINFFSYFTILSNILAGLALTLPLLAPDSAMGRFFARDTVRGGIALYMLVTGLTYGFILRHLWQPQGWAFVADATLHYAMPVLYLIDWLMLAPKARLPWRAALTWLIVPAVYAAYSLLRGPFSGFYPYPFMDVSQLGFGRVMQNSLVLFVVFLGCGLLLIAVGRRLGRSQRQISGQISGQASE